MCVFLWGRAIRKNASIIGVSEIEEKLWKVGKRKGTSW
jgi:hypothetical protein